MNTRCMRYSGRKTHHNTHTPIKTHKRLEHQQRALTNSELLEAVEFALGIRTHVSQRITIKKLCQELAARV